MEKTLFAVDAVFVPSHDGFAQSVAVIDLLGADINTDPATFAEAQIDFFSVFCCHIVFLS
jgi:hypothetical protein